MAGKHTAGPWEFTGCAICVQGMDVARVYHPIRIDEATFNANGRLIASAPDLLEALIRLEEAARAVQAGEWDRNSIQPERDAARAAIARATQPLPPPNEDQP